MTLSQTLTRTRPPIAVLIVALVLSACSAITGPAPTKDVSTSVLMPSIAGYTRILTADVQDAFAKAAAGGALLTGNIEISALITAANRLSTCYHNAGGYEAAVFTNSANAVNSGAIMIINMAVLQNPNVLLTCLNPVGNSPQGVGPKPCTNAYTLSANNNTYQVFYFATDDSVCAAFCSALTGCTAANAKRASGGGAQ